MLTEVLENIIILESSSPMNPVREREWEDEKDNGIFNTGIRKRAYAIKR